MTEFTSLKDIEIISETPIGEGAFSFVYKVKHRKSNKIMAMKKIDLNSLSPADKENLEIEIKLHKNLNHNNIIKFVGYLIDENFVYILLENAENGSLFFYIDIKKGLPENLAIRFFYQTVLGMLHLNENKIVHRDIKPENLLLDINYNIKICDFGWSCKMDADDIR